MEATEPAQYQVSDQGYTITLTDYYATNQAIFLGVKMESEEGFPEMSADSDGKSQIMIATLEEYSFRSGDPGTRGQGACGADCGWAYFLWTDPYRLQIDPDRESGIL